MPNLLATAALASDPDFRTRVAAAVVAAALNVSGEGRDDSRPNWETTRQAYATTILRAPLANLDPFVWAVASNPSISTTYQNNGNSESVPDGDIEFTVASVWDDVSGAAVVVESPAA